MYTNAQMTTSMPQQHVGFSVNQQQLLMQQQQQQQQLLFQQQQPCFQQQPIYTLQTLDVSGGMVPQASSSAMATPTSQTPSSAVTTLQQSILSHSVPTQMMSPPSLQQQQGQPSGMLGMPGGMSYNGGFHSQAQQQYGYQPALMHPQQQQQQQQQQQLYMQPQFVTHPQPQQQFLTSQSAQHHALAVAHVQAQQSGQAHGGMIFQQHQPPQAHMPDAKRQKVWESAPSGTLSFTPNGSNPLTYNGMPQGQLAHAQMLQQQQQHVNPVTDSPRAPTRVFPLSKRCRHVGGCHKKIQSKGLCIQHGGGRRCQNRGGCGKGAAGRTNFCFAHGGGARCKFRLTDGVGCNKHVVVNGLCLKHSRVANGATEVATPEDIAAALVRAQQMIASGVVLAPTSPVLATSSKVNGSSSAKIGEVVAATEVLSECESVFSSPSSSSEVDHQVKQEKGKTGETSVNKPDKAVAKVDNKAKVALVKEETVPPVDGVVVVAKETAC